MADKANAESFDDLLTAGDAAKYLAKKWGREGYSQKAFKMLRHRWNLQPAAHLGNATLWRRDDLDKIPEPDRSKPRNRQSSKKKQKGIDTDDYAMVISA